VANAYAFSLLCKKKILMAVFRFSKRGFLRRNNSFQTDLGRRELFNFPLLPYITPSPSEANALGPVLRRDLEGLKSGFYLKLSLHGVGYRVWLLSSLLLLDLGYNSFLSYAIPSGVGVLVSRTGLLLYGLDYHLITTVADQLMRLRPKDSYSGKGIRSSTIPPLLKKRKKDGK
jgi:hypothetical protein